MNVFLPLLWWLTPVVHAFGMSPGAAINNTGQDMLSFHHHSSIKPGALPNKMEMSEDNIHSNRIARTLIPAFRQFRAVHER